MSVENLSRSENLLQELYDGNGDLVPPQSRMELFLYKLLGVEVDTPIPQSRVEELLQELYDKEITGDIIPKEFTENGVYNAASEGKDGYNPVTVNIPIPPAPVLVTKQISANGTYQASADNADGYSSVEVSVAPPENSFIMNTKKDNVVDISDATDIPIVDLKADVSSASEVMVGVGDGDEFKTDNAPYLFRKSFDKSTELDKIVGGSVAWNQLVRNGDFGDTEGWSTRGGTSFVISNNIATVTFGTDSISGLLNVYMPLVLNHKYLVMADIKSSDTGTLQMGLTTNGGSLTAPYVNVTPTSNWTEYYAYNTLTNAPSSTPSANGLMFRRNSASSFSIDVKNVRIYDITLMFGSTIADYVYTLEQATAGSGITWLKSQGFFTKDYYQYNAGGIESVKTSAHKMVGFNQWDEEWEQGGISSTGYNTSTAGYCRSKNYVLVLPNTNYYFKFPVKMNVFWYDSDKALVRRMAGIKDEVVTSPDGSAYLRFRNDNVNEWTSYNNDICINFHGDGERDGEYEPYVEHTYPLGNDELRGVYTLSNGKIVANGDVKTSDGQITRKYSEPLNLGTLNWSYNSTAQRFTASLSSKASTWELANAICSKYVTKTWGNVQADTTQDKVCALDGSYVMVRDLSYSDAATFKTAMSGVYLVYELATPTTESADPYTNPQIVDNWGTEEYVDERSVPIPVGHETKYFDGEIFFSYIYDGSGNKTTATGTADLITGEVTDGNHCDTFVIKPIGDNVVVESGEVEVKYLAPLTQI